MDIVKFKPTVYIISDGERRAVVNGQVFENLEYSWDDIIEVDDYIVNIHELCNMIDEQEEEINEEDLMPVEEDSSPL
jgi:hypothetical protein